jgi:hypothetical protein
VTANCPAGKVVLNAGFLTTGTVTILSSMPTGGPTGAFSSWIVRGSGGASGGLLTTNLTCVNGTAA